MYLLNNGKTFINESPKTSKVWDRETREFKIPASNRNEYQEFSRG
jgi:hypothetical protein